MPLVLDIMRSIHLRWPFRVYIWFEKEFVLRHWATLLQTFCEFYTDD